MNNEYHYYISDSDAPKVLTISFDFEFWKKKNECYAMSFVLGVK